MWICPNCGEPHQDQFKECWKCVGAEFDEHVTATAPMLRAPKPEPRLRSLSSILLRALIGFGVGTLFGVAAVHRNGVPLEAATFIGSFFGLLGGVIVGVYVWVMYPYEPTRDVRDGPEQGSHTSSGQE